jgi:hypothetical protein
MNTACKHQNVDWKESRRETYFKWGCRFANAQVTTLPLPINKKVLAVSLLPSPSDATVSPLETDNLAA